MLDILLWSKLYDKVVNDSKIENKGKAFIGRGILIVGIPLGIIIAISWIVLYINQYLAAFHIVALLILWSLASVLWPSLVWKAMSSK